jgi:hypothetical protein
MSIRVRKRQWSVCPESLEGMVIQPRSPYLCIVSSRVAPKAPVPLAVKQVALIGDTERLASSMRQITLD